MSDDQLKAAVDQAAAEARTSFMSFGIFALYFMVAVGATSHEDLLRGSQIAMPGLGVGLPVVGFYTIVPLLFLLTHALLLLQTSILASRVSALRRADGAKGETPVHPFFLSVFLQGATQGWAVRLPLLAAVVTLLILLPLSILLFVQVRFLPYHSNLTTSWHRLLLLIDLALIWLLWPRIMSLRAAPGAARPLGTHPWRPRHSGLIALTLVVLVFSFGLATIPRNSEPAVSRGLTYWLFEAPTTPLNMRRNLRIRNARLIQRLPDQATIATLGEEEAWKASGLGLDLRGRDLRFADLSSSDLRKADLRGADLWGAKLASADLRYATLSDVPVTEFADCGAHLRERSEDKEFCKTEISFADLSNADLRAAQFWKARATHANFSYAKLQGANLAWANLEEARLEWIDAEGTSLRGAVLDGAKLSGARLAGADLQAARLPKADLSSADLAFALLGAANLRGANLTKVDLSGAYLFGAGLEGAQLGAADLSGADLRATKLANTQIVHEDPFQPSSHHGPHAREQYAFFAWADVRGADWALKPPPDLPWSLLGPQALPRRSPDSALDGAEVHDYEVRLAKILTARVCRSGAAGSLVSGFAKRLLEDLYDNSLTRKCEGKANARVDAVDSLPLRAFHEEVADLLVEPLPSADQERSSESSCQPFESLPLHLRGTLRTLRYAPQDLLPPTGCATNAEMRQTSSANATAAGTR